MKKTIAAVSAAALLVSALPVRDAQANAATDLGTKVAEKILTSIAGEAAGKVFAVIFGGDSNPLTLQQVEGAINSAFTKAAVRSINGDVNGLKSKVNDYIPSRDKAFVQDLIDRTGDIKGDIDAQIVHDNALNLIPNFISIWNTRLGFAAERYRRTKEAGDKSLIAKNAIDGLNSLEGYLEQDFNDPKRHSWPCVKKDAATALTLNGGVGSNWSEKAVDVSTQYCYGNGRVLKQMVQTAFAGKVHVTNKGDAEKVRHSGYRDGDTVNLGGAWYMKDIGIGRARSDHSYMFARRMDKHGKEYFLEKTPNKWFAQWLRNHYIVKYYPRELGDLHAQILAWVDIAKATGSHWQLRQAWTAAFKLGIGWNTLRSRYGSGVNGDLNLFIPLFKHHGENREIND